MSLEVPEFLQKEIRAVLLSKIGGVPLSELKKDYRKLIGHDLDYISLGFCSLKQLLLSVPDVARVVLVTKTNTEKVYGVSSTPLSSMNYTERKAHYIPKEGEELITANVDMNANSNKFHNSNPAMAGKQSLRQYVEMNIVCNKRNLWTLCFPLKEHMSDEDVINLFSPYGTVAEVSFTQKYVFVRFTTKQSAVDAFVSLKEEFDIRLASEGGDFRKKKIHNTDAKEHSYKKANSGIQICSKGVGRGFLGCRTARSANNRPEHITVGRGYKLGSHSSSSSQRSSHQSVGLGMSSSPNRDHTMKTFSTDNVASDKFDMPCLEDIDGLPDLESCDPTTDKQQSNSADEDYNPRHTFGTDHQLHHSYKKGHVYREPESRHQLDIPEKKQYEGNVESSNQRGNDDSQKRNVFELFVKNFPYGTTPDKLVQPFIPYGAKGVEIVRDEYGKGTLALVQFVDYEQAAQAVADLDGIFFHHRNLVVGFQQTGISQEDIIRKRLKKLIVTVKFDSNQGSDESRRRQVMLEDDAIKDDGFDDDVDKDNDRIGQNKIRNTSHDISPQSSSHCHGIQHIKGQQGIKSHDIDQSYQYMNKSNKKKGCEKDNDLSMASDSSGSSYTNRQEAVSLSNDATHSKQSKSTHKLHYHKPEPGPSAYTRDMSHDATVKQPTLPSGAHNAKHNNNIVGLGSVNNCNRSNQQGALVKEEFTVQQKVLQPSPPTDKPMWVSPPGREELGSAKYNDFKDKPLQYCVLQSGSEIDASVPTMMRGHIMEQMINDLCPGHRLLTVNDMLPQLEVFVTYKENETYFWGSVISGHFKQSLERLYRLTQDFDKLSYSHPVSGNKGMAQYNGEWFRVWLYGGNKVNADIMYVDYGNTETVSRSKISGLPDKYWQIPPLAVPFKLEDPLNMTITENEMVRLTVVASAEENHIIVVKA